MCRAIEEMINDTIFRTHLENIKKIMDGLHITAHQAMDILEIPEADRPRYLAAL